MQLSFKNLRMILVTAVTYGLFSPHKIGQYACGSKNSTPKAEDVAVKESNCNNLFLLKYLNYITTARYFGGITPCAVCTLYLIHLVSLLHIPVVKSCSCVGLDLYKSV